MILVVSGCAQITRAERYVAPPLGSSWVFARSDSGSFGSASSNVTTKRGEQVWQGAHVTSYEAPGFTQLIRDDGKVIAFLNGDKPIMSFEPPLGFVYPLEVGKTFTTEHRVTIYQSRQTVPIQVTQKVEAYEDVTVPAGTFKAYRISWSESVGNENVYWLSPELGFAVKSVVVRTAKFSAGPGRRESELVSETVRK